MILYELLTGRQPFRGATVYATLHQVKTAEPVPPSRLVPGLPRDIETIAAKCLRKDPGKRYPSALALAEDLARFQAGEPILARPVGVPERGWRWCRRNPALAASLGAVGAAVLALAGLSLLYASLQIHFAEKQDEARREADLQLAKSDFERGETLCEKGELGTGLLRLIASWHAAREAADPSWQNVARASLSCWQREYSGPRAVFSHRRSGGSRCLQSGRPNHRDRRRRSHRPALEPRDRPPALPPLGAQGAGYHRGLCPRRQDARHRQL